MRDDYMLVFPQKLLTEHCTFRCQAAYTYLCPSYGRPSACSSLLLESWDRPLKRTTNLLGQTPLERE